jgi:hypothetical protein
MNKIIVFLISFLIMCPVHLALGAESDLRKELEGLKQRMLELEAQLKTREESKTIAPAATEEKTNEIEQILKGRFGSLSIHGGAVGYYQGRNDARYDDGEDFGNPDGFGIAADLELGFKPMPGGELIMRLHFGEGDGADRDVTDRLGLFARAGYHNDDVYDVPFSWSVGVNLKELISGRADDELGFGIAGLHGNHGLPVDDEDLRDEGVELHLELYYRIALSDSFAITPDIQYVISPLGNDKNDDIFTGMLRAEWGF